MPLNFPSSPTNGQQYTDDNAVVWEYDSVKWSVVTGTANKTYSGCKIGFTADYNLTSTETAVSFDDEIFDTDLYFTLSQDTRITFRRSAFYRINLSIYTSADGSSYTVTLKKNGTVELASAVLSPNQFTNYDEIIELSENDYVEIYALDSASTGALTSSSILEITRIGLSIGTFIASADAFSGARAVFDTSSSYATTSTASAINWYTAGFDQNANPAGETYWNSTDVSRLTVKITGFYRIKAVIVTGATDSYTAELKKNGATSLGTANIEPNGYAQIDEIYELSVNDYIELYINDQNSTGSLLDNSYLEIVRVGV